MIQLMKASFSDCDELHLMQQKAFAELLAKYRDFDTNPACESIEVIQRKMMSSDYYFITNNTEKVGAVRIINLGEKCRISPMCILPEYQNNGYAQAALLEAEKLFPDIRIGCSTRLNKRKSSAICTRKWGIFRQARKRISKAE